MTEGTMVMDTGSQPRPPKRPRSQQSTRACVHCQRRKTRCSGHDNGRVACAYCQAANKLCSFDRRPDRTPLTRQNLESAKKVGGQLRMLLRTLNPDLDIDTALLALDGQQGISGSDSGGPAGVGSPARQEEESDAPLDRYEWREAHRPHSGGGAHASTDNRDGMAILPSVNAGYLGRSSGSDIFQEVAGLLPASAITNAGRRNKPLDAQIAVEPRVGFDPAWLPSSAVTNRFVDAYFQLYNTSYPIVHEAVFRAEISDSGRMLSASVTWRIIYYMVLAIGHWLSSKGSNSLEQCPYYAAARSRVSMELLEAGSTRTVQGFLLMGNYLQKRDRPNTGYNLIGLAHRIAVGIGLHREKSSSDDTIMFERYRQLFWTVYCFDSGFNITTGRPIAAMEGFIDQSLPRNIDDRDCDLSSPVPPIVDYPTTYSALIAQTRMAKIANAIYHEFLSARTANKKVEYQIAEMMAHKLDTWKASLPSYFEAADVPAWFLGPRAVILWKEQNLRILLWRETKQNHPYLPMNVDSKRRCLWAAMETIQSISTYCESNQSSLHPGITWYATYYIFQATLVLEASYLSQRSAANEAVRGDHESWESTVATAKRCLEVLAANNSHSAHSCLDLIEHIHSSTQIQAEDTGMPNEGNTQDSAGLMQDPFTWTTEMDENVTDPIMRSIIDDAFWGFNFSSIDSSGLPSDGVFDRVMDF